MSTYARPEGSGSAGVYITNDRYTLDDANQMKNCIDLQSTSGFMRGIELGGSRIFDIVVTADGDYDLPFKPFKYNNTSNRFSAFTDATGGATFTRLIQFLVQVSDAAISATPKMRYAFTWGGIAVAGTGTVATISGAAACSAVAEDFSGTDQYQELTLTLPSGEQFWKPQITIAGTGGNPYSFRALAIWNTYLSL